MLVEVYHLNKDKWEEFMWEGCAHVIWITTPFAFNVANDRLELASLPCFTMSILVPRLNCFLCTMIYFTI